MYTYLYILNLISRHNIWFILYWHTGCLDRPITSQYVLGDIYWLALHVSTYFSRNRLIGQSTVVNANRSLTPLLIQLEVVEPIKVESCFSLFEFFASIYHLVINVEPMTFISQSASKISLIQTNLIVKNCIVQQLQMHPPS